MDVFFGVKGVDDVLAGLDVELGVVFSLVRSSSQLSSASVTCLLDVELLLCFLGVKGVVDVLAGVEQGAYGGVYGDGVVDGFFSRIFRGFRALPGRPGVERQFLEPSMTKSSSLSRAPLHN